MFYTTITPNGESDETRAAIAQMRRGSRRRDTRPPGINIMDIDEVWFAPLQQRLAVAS